MSTRKAQLVFAAWEPDKAQISGAMSEAKGVIAQSGRYVPLKTPVALKPATAIGDKALGGGGFFDATSTVRVFVGDRTKLYEIKSRTPVDVSTIGGYVVAPDWAWSFEQFGQSVYATARGLPQIQRYQLGTSTRFDPVATGPGFSDVLFRIRDHLFSGYQKTIKNSAFNNPLDWVPDSGTLAGAFDLPHDGGDITAGTGGQFGIVFQERKVHRLTHTGSGQVPFQRDEIEERRGAFGPNAIARYGTNTFFASDDGIRMTDGQQSIGIGENKVNRWFAGQLNYAARSQVSIAVDVEKQVLKIAFPANGSAVPNKIIMYSMVDGQWTYDDLAVDLLFAAPKQGIALDDDAAVIAIAGTNVLDSIAIPLDSPVWRESRTQVMVVDSTHMLGTFEGANRPAVIETGYGEVAPSRKGFVTEVWPLTDAATCTAAITTKLARLSDSGINHAASTMNSAGYCPVRAEARWIRARLEIPGNTAWTEASGIEWDVRGSGEL
ncbi:MAG: hypothetical protein ACRCS9_00745 [Hyphomicrobium sp.]